MKKRVVIVGMLSLIWLLAGSLAGAADEAHRGGLESYYSRLVDEAVAKCEAKARLRNSWSERVRRTAAVAHLKGAYFKAYKEELVHGMLDEEVGPEPYKVHYYLNKQFYRVVHKEANYLVKR